MTEQTNAELTNEDLIAWAKSLGDPNFTLSVPGHAKTAFRALATALEAADQRAEQAEAELRDVWRTDIPSLKDHRDTLAAVVEKVRAYLEEGKGAYAPDLLDILATDERGASVSGYTPTTDEIRHEYAVSYVADYQQESRAEFDRWLAAHDAKVRAEALREAYADLQAYTDSGAPFGHRPVEEFLLHRADRIEREAGLK